MDIDYEKLRADLIDYYGSSMFSGFPMAIIDLSKIEQASFDELIEVAQKNNWDLTKYQINNEEENIKSL